MLIASRRIELFERYRVPYEIDPSNSNEALYVRRAEGAGPQLISLTAPAGTLATPYLIDGTTVYARLADRSACSAMMEQSGLDWSEATPIIDLEGVPRGAIFAAQDGSALVPFAIDGPLDTLLEEAYLHGSKSSALYARARDTYYRVRPLLPYRVQLALRRRFRWYQRRARFPRWPIETSLHRLEAQLLNLVEQVAGEPLPWIAPWPTPFTWSLVLTHDVERLPGYRYIATVRTVEEEHKLPSAWYFVPERDYTVETAVLDTLRESGCEIGLQGLRHDGRDLSDGVFQRRLPAMRRYAQQWGARGFRGPATHRNPAFLRELGLDHDSSWCDVAGYEPQPGGTCSWLPFFIGDVVELPITLPMDHTLFEILGELTGATWMRKTAFLRDQGGMTLILTHPDYLLDPTRLALYERFLDAYAADPTAWHALPRDVASWWRDRSATTLVRDDGRWTARGPGASLARVNLGAPEPPPPTAAV